MIKGMNLNLGEIVWIEYVWTSEAEQVIVDQDLLEICFMLCFEWVVCEPILTFLYVITVQKSWDASVSLFQLHLLEICFMSCFLCVVSQCWHFWTSSLCKRARMHLFHYFNFSATQDQIAGKFVSWACSFKVNQILDVVSWQLWK